jgi:hypothetical protein
MCRSSGHRYLWRAQRRHVACTRRYSLREPRIGVVNYTTGQWYDSENERGGGVKELIHVFKEIEDRDAAIAYAEALRYFLGKFR